MSKKNIITPVTLPVLSFLSIIAIGTLLLHLPISGTDNPISWLDALFTATSATCVTGLVVVDTGTFFSPFGQSVILLLIQVGGLGIMTYTTLVFFLLKKRISLTDRIAVGQNLLHDPAFHLGNFLIKIVSATLLIEFVGAILIWMVSWGNFTLFSAFFHSVSAFCNAGFSLYSNSLMDWSSHWGINIIFIGLIVLGGLGFAVLLECRQYLKLSIQNRKSAGHLLSWHSRIVLKTTFGLIIMGWIIIFASEYFHLNQSVSWNEGLITSLFQSVTCRTAGFNTLEMSQMTTVSLVTMILLMIIGGSPGSCAGGIKTTTFRTIWAFILSHLYGRRQAVIGKYAVDENSLNKALTLVIFYIMAIGIAVFILCFSEGGNAPQTVIRGKFLEIVFEVVSAIGTVGLSTGITSHLTELGKCVLIILMFVGRLGPILFISVLQSWQTKPRYAWPENSLMVG